MKIQNIKNSCLTWLRDRGILLVVLMPIPCAFVFGIYILANSLNPESKWCDYKIYKQTDGTYQVWWSRRTRHLEGTFKTYDAAKAFQVKECNDLIRFKTQKPTGELTK